MTDFAFPTTPSPMKVVAKDLLGRLTLVLSVSVDQLLRATSVKRQRHHLAQLSDRELQDLGITRAQAQVEAKRSFWDLP